MQLAAGEAAGRPGEVEVVEADVDKKRYPREQFAEEIGGDFPLGVGKRHALERPLEPAQGHAAPDIEGAAPEGHRRGDIGQSAAAALAAGDLAEHRIDPAAESDDEPGRLLAGLLEPLETEREPWAGLRGSGARRQRRARHLDPPLASPLEEHALLEARELDQRHVGRQAAHRAQRDEHRLGDGARKLRPEVEGPIGE